MLAVNCVIVPRRLCKTYIATVIPSYSNIVINGAYLMVLYKFIPPITNGRLDKGGMGHGANNKTPQTRGPCFIPGKLP